jgi:glycosyltransferase involved in cell wall biosynthesis
MNVIYDISVFGLAQRWPNTTGIFRVVDNLARVLMDSEKCELHFSATEMEWHYHAVKHTKDSPDSQAMEFPHSAWRYQLFRQFLKANQRAVADGFSKNGWRLARKLLHRSVYAWHPKFLQEASFDQANVFHSPYFPIPEEARGRKNLSAFITVHDLIGVLFPQFFENEPKYSQHHLAGIISSIQPDDWVICVSQNTKKDLCNYRSDIDPNHVVVTYLGAADWFYPCRDQALIEIASSKYKIPAGQYILSVCTFEPRKNLPHLIRCFSRLVQQESLKDLQLVLVGGLGWKYESIFKELIATNESVRHRIILVGRVADEDMAALYSGAIAFIFPSLYEGFGLPPLEAMQCGTPVITANTSSLPEVVGDAGIMVDPHDADGLCQAMLKLMTKTDLRQAMSKKSLEQAGRFSWSNCANQTLAAYKMAIDSKN